MATTLEIRSTTVPAELMRVACEATGGGLSEQGLKLTQISAERLPKQNFDECVSFDIVKVTESGFLNKLSGSGPFGRVDVIHVGDGSDESGYYQYRAKMNPDGARVLQESYPLLPFTRRTRVIGFAIYRKYLDALGIAVKIADSSAECRIDEPSS